MGRTTVLLIVSALVLCRAIPAPESGGRSGVIASSSPFDLGAVSSCRRPSTNVCSIDYEVPESIAALADLIETEIQGRLSILDNIPNGDGCRPRFLEAMCAYRFPRCNQERTSVFMKSLVNCTQKIQASCPSEISALVHDEGVCQLDATVPLDSCAPLSESQVQLQRCSVVDPSTSVTAWMLEYIKLIDSELNLKFTPRYSLSTLWSQPDCSANTAKYYCQFYGQCTGDGRIETRNTEGFCDDVINW